MDFGQFEKKLSSTFEHKYITNEITYSVIIDMDSILSNYLREISNIFLKEAMVKIEDKTNFCVFISSEFEFS